MPDEWDASPVTLTNAGDWASWTITLGSGDAADLNDGTGTSDQFLAIRWAMSAASRSGYYALSINDTVGEGIGSAPPQLLVSSGGWVSAGRFRGGLTGIGALAAVDFPDAANGSVGGTGDAPNPWVTGANTVRLLWYGRDPDNAAEPVQIDFIAIQTGSGFSIIDDWGNFGTDGSVGAQDLKPITGTPVGYTGYDDLADGGTIRAGGKKTWLLRGADATTGTAADTNLEVIKFCPPTATVRVTNGSLVTGVVGAHTTGDTALDTLDGSGEATFTITVGDDYTFWYAGNDDWTPAFVFVDELERIGCGGWHVGYIAIGA